MCGYLENREASVSCEEVAALIRRHIAENDWKSVLLLPPDITHSHSGTGFITA